MNPNTMTIEAIRDELARREHWRKPDPERGRVFWSNEKTAAHPASHPIPATLDEAAKLPEGWEWERIRLADGNMAWLARRPTNTGYPIRFLDSGNEKDDRFRLRLACTIADEGSSA